MPNIPIPMQPNNKTCSFSGELNFCSNFYYAEILYKGQKFKTAEHAYQWSKCKYDADKAAICEAKTPVEAKKIGKKATIIDNWDNSRIPIMYEILKCKFSLPFLKQKLLNTGDQELVNENYWRDQFWGIFEGKGENWLGRLLMRIRKELQDTVTYTHHNEASFSTSKLPEKIKDDSNTNYDKYIQTMNDGMIQDKIKILNSNKKIIKHKYDQEISVINEEIFKIRKSCPHNKKRYFPDPSGNSDSFEECEICGFQNKRIQG